ncbi:MAG: LL-diaminopimelate aminotransferase [Clostridiales bacterium]|nr:LL-diaminopimelate aminotransferase [Clostridiales bacterium]
MNINKNYKNLQENYLFAEVSSRVAGYKAAHPEADVISLGIGDVTKPLAPSVVSALKAASDEMASEKGFRGYGPYEGYGFLIDAVRGYYAERGITLGKDEVFVSDGAKNELGSVIDIFDKDNTVLITDPVYPVYLDSNVMSGRKIIYAAASEANNFLPLPDRKVKSDIIYLCSPNNPTGAVYTKEMLGAWVDYANENDAVILYDAAYEAFVTDKSLPRSIYEIDGARTCAIELCSLSKTAGFTGTRCGYTVFPSALKREGVTLGKMWLRNRSTKFNGVSYIIQRAAEAVFTPAGRRESQADISYYLDNARIIMTALSGLNVKYWGGINAPYIWLKCPGGESSWSFFDRLLNGLQIVGTPGSGFGKCGEGYFRLTAFGTRERVAEACQRLKKL